MNLLICFLLANSTDIPTAIQRASDSTRVTLLDESDSERLGSPRAVPPGLPPVLSFRYMEGSKKHRFGDLDLMVDDAGH